jgi:hypothetical protein
MTETMSIEVGLSFGRSPVCVDLAELAAKMPCFDGVRIISADFVWGETVNEHGCTIKMGKAHAHITGVKDEDGNDVYQTLCGIKELGGNWSFAFPYGDKPSRDECKRCRKVYDRLRGKQI